MTILSVFPHGVTGTWLDEIISLGLPLVVLVVLYLWSKGKPKEKRTTTGGRRPPRTPPM